MGQYKIRHFLCQTGHFIGKLWAKLPLNCTKCIDSEENKAQNGQILVFDPTALQLVYRDPITLDILPTWDEEMRRYRATMMYDATIAYTTNKNVRIYP